MLPIIAWTPYSSEIERKSDKMHHLVFEKLENWLSDRWSIYRPLDPEKSFFDLKKISLKQTNLCIAIRLKKSFFYLWKFLDCFF